jgi:hypothetical protein
VENLHVLRHQILNVIPADSRTSINEALRGTNLGGKQMGITVDSAEADAEGVIAIISAFTGF